MNRWRQMLPLSVFYKHCAELLARLNAEAAPILLTHKGRSVAVLVDLDTYALLEQARKTQDAYLSRLCE